jgi:uncharacterized protein (UPF0261 family)
MELEKRKLYIQDALRVQARISADEMEVIGRIFAEKVNRARGRTAVFVPLKGFSALGTEDALLHDPESDMALIGSLRKHLDARVVDLVEMACAYSDDIFAQALAHRFLEMLEANRPGEVSRPADSGDHQHGGEAA